jgi:hypothetical protein
VKLHGSLQAILEGAIFSAKRHRGRHVYAETVAFWTDLVALAWRETRIKSGSGSATLAHLAEDLEREITARSVQLPASQSS